MPNPTEITYTATLTPDRYGSELGDPSDNWDTITDNYIKLILAIMERLYPWVDAVAEVHNRETGILARLPDEPLPVTVSWDDEGDYDDEIAAGIAKELDNEVNALYE